MSWGGVDNRKFPRIEQRCRLIVESKGAPQIIESLTENIGAGGICVALGKNLGLFQRVSLELYLEKNGSTIHCDGTIVWILKRRDDSKKGAALYDTGIEFSNISDSDRALVSALVERISSSKLDNQKNA